MLNWYDQIAGVYDLVQLRSYRKPREALIEKMSLQEGDKVLLVGCGTGLIFQLIQNKVGLSGMVVGVDTSKNMLRQARRKVDKNNWKNTYLIHEDAQKLSSNLIAEHVGKDVLFDHIIGELSFSVMDNWQLVMVRSLVLLKEKGKLGILDGYRGKRGLINALLNFLPRSDISRPISSYADRLTDNYERQEFGFAKIVFIGIGRKAGT